MDKNILENYERYRDRLKLFKSFGYDMDKEKEFIIKNVQPIKGEILEIGTGKGHFAMVLAQKGYQFTSVDISEEEQKFAKMNLQYLELLDKVKFVVADAAQLHFSDESYDSSFGINIIHHLDQPLKVIDEFIRVVRPGGKIVLSDFNKVGFEIIQKIHESNGGNHSSGVCTLNEVVEYVQAKGFQTERFASQYQDLVIMKKRSI